MYLILPSKLTNFLNLYYESFLEAHPIWMDLGADQLFYSGELNSWAAVVVGLENSVLDLF